MGILFCAVPAFIFGALAIAMGLFSLFYEYWAQYQLGYLHVNFGLFINCQMGVKCEENDLNQLMMIIIALLISGIVSNLLALLLLCFGIYKESKFYCSFAGTMWMLGCILSLVSAGLYTFLVLTDRLEGGPPTIKGVKWDLNFGTSWDVAFGSAGFALMAGVAALLTGHKIEDGFAPTVLPNVTKR